MAPCVRTKGHRGHEYRHKARNAPGERAKSRQGNMPSMRYGRATEADRTTTDLVLASLSTSRVRGTPRGRSRCHRGQSGRPRGHSRAPHRHVCRPNAGVTCGMPSCGLRIGATRSRKSPAVRSQVGFDLQRHMQRTHGRPIHAVRQTSVTRRAASEAEQSARLDAAAQRSEWDALLA